MILRYVWPTLTFCALSLALTACQSPEGEQLPVNVINITGDAGFVGCIQPSFPPEQPSLSPIGSPFFVTDADNRQATADPGDDIEARIAVNGATRYARVELKDSSANIPPAATVELDTPGNERLEVFFAEGTTRIGRYYLRITLCGLDCDEREVVFDMNPDVNSDYERTLIENGEVAQVDRTCFGIFPQATVLIQ